MAHPNEELTRRGLDAFSKGDLSALDDLFDENIVWHVGGRSPLSGDYRGRQEVYGFFGKTMELSGGSFRLDVHDVLANDDHVVVLSTAHAERGGKTLDNNGIQVLHVADGKVVESWLHPADQYETDDFWS
ncbi:MAG TPA: nuclear transport factor 2 family protein [Actinomycetota bacterium]|nr:nuclear transport factor 2 family protein [Actinomycetota bacterium]